VQELTAQGPQPLEYLHQQTYISTSIINISTNPYQNMPKRENMKIHEKLHFTGYMTNRKPAVPSTQSAAKRV
jgi:hypothetical protein